MSSNEEKTHTEVLDTMEEEDEENDDEQPEEENIQLSLDPKVQAYLAQVEQQQQDNSKGCCCCCLGRRFFPLPFERASRHSWWDPTFDSEILEQQFGQSAHSHGRFRFRYALSYMLLIWTCWFLYFIITGLHQNFLQHHYTIIIVVVVTTTITIIITSQFLTRTRIYKNHLLSFSLTVAFVLCSVSLLLIVLVPKSTQISPVGHFSICIAILMVIYTLVPLKLYMSVTLGLCYSTAFEVLTHFSRDDNDATTSGLVAVRVFCHACIHLIGLHILIMTNVRMRNTFMRVGQSLLVKRQLESEKRLKENMIHSLMPPSVAHWLLNEDENFASSSKTEYHRTSNGSHSENDDIRSIFRPFNMNRVENVSILFADIVGFTKMASKKSAEELVDILNDLFQRFDHLCKEHNCEKISTLGDCYYCVSGCPEPRFDHASCCVEMGLGMIKAIGQFERDRKEGVNMRVGVHTGTVLCGIVGTKRFKFDVWSNDVTLANRMESTGRPGTVHISEKTKDFLRDLYVLEQGDAVHGLNTYFILGKAGDTRTPSYTGSFRAEGRQKYTNSLQLFISPPPPNNSNSPSPQTRPRVLSYDTSSNYLKQQNHNNNPNNNMLLSPDVCKIKASSLPSILDSDGESAATQDYNNLKKSSGHVSRKDSDGGENVKTPTSTASSGKYSVKRIKGWKIPKFLQQQQQDQKEGPIEDLTQQHQVPTIVESIDTKSRIIIDADSSTTEDERPILDDIKSYISQSRSDVMCHYDDLNHFMKRAGSYRSQYGRSPVNDLSFLHRAGSNRSRRGRSPNFDNIVPSERARSATMTVAENSSHNGDYQRRRPKMSLEVPGMVVPTIVGKLSSSTCSNNTTTGDINCHDEDNNCGQYGGGSRKDSGIRSNSRRSSIQQVGQGPDTLLQQQQRVSGYYTSSQSSTINVPPIISSAPPSSYNDDKLMGGPTTCLIQNLRKQSDRQLIRCVQENSKSRSSYFLKPPLSRWTMLFKDPQIERDYRRNVHVVSETNNEAVTLADSKFNTYFDVLVSSLVFLTLSFCLLILYGFSTLWIVAFVCFLVVLSASWGVLYYDLLPLVECVVSRFYKWNCFGGVLVSLPLISVIVNFNTSDELSCYYTYLLFVGIIHFCNFTQLSCWMKNILVTVFTTLVFVPLFCTSSHHNDAKKGEMMMDLLILLLLVWLLNREFEIAYRLSFHANYVSNRDQINVQMLKNQADYLIYNIVPEHVAEQLKKNAKYSENFKNVGIIFASIVNFNEMYDESYQGGKEFLRVLNELIGDFDELLDRPEFRSVEKIKTIGSTFMAASGLNSQTRLEQKDANEHLYALMDFALEMQNVIADFNRDLLGFDLVLRIGYNFGDVTAAVIGNTKLYYDIWGDAVNIASRMDSTGVDGCIQIGEHCTSVLGKKYLFKPRGSVYVKGKDNMNVYLLERPEH